MKCINYLTASRMLVIGYISLIKSVNYLTASRILLIVNVAVTADQTRAKFNCRT